MNMQESDFRRALEIITQLHEAGFSMSMTKKGLEVSKY